MYFRVLAEEASRCVRIERSGKQETQRSNIQEGTRVEEAGLLTFVLIADWSMVPRASFSQTEIYKQSLKLAETSYQEKEADFKARLHRLQKEVDDVTQSKEREATAFEQKMVVLFF